MKNICTLFILSLVALISFPSCNNDNEISIPKPRGYFRIELPAKKYMRFDSIYPYSFEYPSYGKIVPRTDSHSEFGWIDIKFPVLRGEINVSYKPVENNLSKLLKDSYEFAGKHVQKATEINETKVSNAKSKVYGTVYEIKGAGTASVYQFVLTDSVNHFFRGALYFNTSPNNDSLAPVLDYVKKDIDHMIQTFNWKNSK